MNAYEMKLENLKLVANLRCDNFKLVHDKIANQVSNIINGIAAESGIAGYEVCPKSYGGDFGYLELHKEGGHNIDLYFYDNRHRYFSKETEELPRQVELYVSAMGTFGVNKVEAVEYYTMVGFLASRLADMSAKLNAIEGWNELYEARRQLRFAQDEIEKAEREEQERIAAERVSAVERRFAVGQEIAVDKLSRWSSEEHKNVYTNIVVRKVEKVTAKLVWFEGDWRQYKKDTVLKALARGLANGGYSFADEVTVEALNAAK